MSHSIAERRPQIGPVTSEALARVTYLLQRPLGCGVVIGPARSGKSALLRQLAIAVARQGAQTATIDGQGLDARGLTWELAAQWRIGPALDGHNRRLTQELRDFMHGATLAGEQLAILLDHADRLEHSGSLMLARLLHEFETQRGLTLIWAAESPLRGDAADLLLPFTELRIDSPALTQQETADYARATWQQAAAVTPSPLPDELAQQLAALSRNELRRADRLSRLSQLAALADGAPLTGEMLEAVAAELV